MSGTLFVIGTPIGNLEDISTRGAATLRAADLCLAEDTRRTATLMRHVGSKATLRSLHEHNERSRIDDVLTR
ncbi:MAG: rRNA (cytidine-2'-O-)-methyltransferase, partial [Gemmatimonadetes bacterium]|nr:rRNA (cytidine-2'-O-)-methyltransferase [Gemmatimonadota bacterium]